MTYDERSELINWEKRLTGRKNCFCKKKQKEIKFSDPIRMISDAPVK